MPFGASLLVLMAVNLALVVPFAPPANLGTLELGATLALMEYGVPKEHALAFALVYHLLQVIPIGVGGLTLAGRSLLVGRRAAGAPGHPGRSAEETPLSRSLAVAGSAVLAVLLLSMAWLAARGPGRDRDAESKNAQFLGGLGDFVLHWFLWLVAPAATLARSASGSPRTSTTSPASPSASRPAPRSPGAARGRRLGARPLRGVRHPRRPHRARQGVTSRYGAFIDSVLDRFIELFFFVGFAFLARHRAAGRSARRSRSAGRCS